MLLHVASPKVIRVQIHWTKPKMNGQECIEVCLILQRSRLGLLFRICLSHKRTCFLSTRKLMNKMKQNETSIKTIKTNQPNTSCHSHTQHKLRPPPWDLYLMLTSLPSASLGCPRRHGGDGAPGVALLPTQDARAERASHERATSHGSCGGGVETKDEAFASVCVCVEDHKLDAAQQKFEY